jgi:ATPase subunit of ABC transporter with duplicated ATPase domains
MTHPQILIHEMSFNLPTGHTIFNKLRLALAKQKIGLVGKNGIGKSTLIKLIAGELHPLSGSIHIEGTLDQVPQNPSISSELTVAGILGYEEKLNALHRIKQGSSDPNDFSILNDDWAIKDRLRKALKLFGLDMISQDMKLNMLSGGELTRLLLTKAFSSNADFLLLDEPTNHLDMYAREQLYHAIQKWEGGFIVASHDRTLLNLMDDIVEISSLGVSSFSGNYDAYKAQKECLTDTRQNQFFEAKKSLEKTKNSIQLTKEKHEQRQAQGRVLRKRGDQPKMLLDAMENRSTASQGSLLIRHNRMLDSAHEKLQIAKKQLELIDEIHVELPSTHVPNVKVILELEDLIFSYYEAREPLINNFNLMINGPERIALSGDNGSGKTTLIKLILNQLHPAHGKIYLGTERVSYLDQNANQLNPDLSILENFMKLNGDAKENDAYQVLASFLFKNVTALKLVKHLSGGEKLRALLACTLMSNHPPQLCGDN